LWKGGPPTLPTLPLIPAIAGRIYERTRISPKLYERAAKIL
jgi:hypothetical protein